MSKVEFDFSKLSVAERIQLAEELWDSIPESADITLRFARVSRALELDVGKEFEFQKWRLKYERADTEARVSGLAMQPDKAFGNMMCKIIGTRGAF